MGINILYCMTLGRQHIAKMSYLQHIALTIFVLFCNFYLVVNCSSLHGMSLIYNTNLVIISCALL